MMYIQYWTNNNFILILSWNLQELVVRVCFILGNLTSKSEKVREAIFFDEAFIAVLLSVMQSYFNLELEVWNL